MAGRKAEEEGFSWMQWLPWGHQQDKGDLTEPRQKVRARWACRMPKGQDREPEEGPASIPEQTPRMIQEVKATDSKKQPIASVEQSADKRSRLSSWAVRERWTPGDEAV